MAKLTVWVVVEFEPLRGGIGQALQDNPDIEVVGESGSLEAAVNSPTFDSCDVVLLDVDALNRADTSRVLGELGETVCNLRVLFLGHVEDAFNLAFDSLATLLRLHTMGFVAKSGPAERLVQSLRLVASGAMVCETDVIKRILGRLSHWAAFSANGRTPDQLSDRELEVLSHLTLGKPNREIANALFLSEGTIKAHVSHIMSKLNVDRRTELVRYALTHGLVSISEDA